MSGKGCQLRRSTQHPLITISDSYFSEKTDLLGCTQLDLNRMGFFFDSTPASGFGLLNSAKSTSNQCCIDPLRPPRLPGVKVGRLSVRDDFRVRNKLGTRASPAIEARCSTSGLWRRLGRWKTPPNTILETSMMYAVPRCLHVIAEMGIADALGDEPRTATDLAASTGANAGALARALRLVSAYGIFEPRNDVGGHKGYVHTPASRLLRTDHPQSMRSFVRMIGSPLDWKSFGYQATPSGRVNPHWSRSRPGVPGHTTRSIPKRAASLTKP